MGISIWLAYITAGKEGVDLWKTVLERLPFTAPLIWLGWFSAIQYGILLFTSSSVRPRCLIKGALKLIRFRLRSASV
jgi:hypothetical protein